MSLFVLNLSEINNKSSQNTAIYLVHSLAICFDQTWWSIYTQL